MKKYIKPELFFEHFELSRNISASCGWQITSVENMCGFKAAAANEWSDLNLIIINGNVAGCDKVATAEMYCYMTMADDQNTFNPS